jgi:hypothetical protein
MKNAVISFIIFGLMIIVMFFSVNYLDKVCSNLKETSNQLEEVINNEQWDKAYEISTYMLQEWKKHHLIIPAFANHAELDNLNNEMLKLTQYIECKTKDESLASTHVIKFFLENVMELQKVNLQNIF